MDTFSSLLEKCLMALDIKASDSTTRSNDDKSAGAGSYHDSEHQVNITRKALLYDKDHVLINMVREVKEREIYYLEIIDSDLMQYNGLESPALI